MPEKPKITADDLNRVEKKLDMLLNHFNVGRRPRRSNKELSDMAAATVLDIEKKRQTRNGQNRGK